MINLGTSTMQDFALGDNLVERIDLGDTTIFDPYTTLTGTLPLSFNSRVAGALKDYRLYGTSAGSGTPTESGEPAGFKIPILNTSGVTENLLIDNPYKTNYYIDENGQETAYSNFNIYATETLDTSLGEYSFYFATYDGNSRVRIHGYSNGVWQQQITSIILTNTATITKPQGIDEIRISCALSWTGRTLVKGSTPPDHYIPHRYESNYDLFIGDSKLYEDEYLDYGEQKIYRTILLTTHDNKDFITSDNNRFCVRRSDNA